MTVKIRTLVFGAAGALLILTPLAAQTTTTTTTAQTTPAVTSTSSSTTTTTVTTTSSTAAEPFTITLPPGFAPFVSQATTTASPDGPVRTTTWVSKAPTGEAIVVTMSKMPGKILDPQKMIAGTRDSMIKSLKATVESETPLTGNLSGTNILFHSEASPVFLRSELFVEGDRLFQILYVGRSMDQRSAATIAQMFDSFHLAAVAVAAPAP